MKGKSSGPLCVFTTVFSAIFREINETILHNLAFINNTVRCTKSHFRIFAHFCKAQHGKICQSKLKDYAYS